MKLLDPFHPAFDKPWVRYVTAFPALVWGGVELWMGNPGWGLIFLGLGVYAFWQLFIVRPKGK